jgi:tetratricopeptide (TPR) repeat protein
VPDAALSTRLRGTLDDIVLHALAKRPEARYASARAFADDVRRYLKGEGVRAPRRPTRAVRIAVPVGLAVAATIAALVITRASGRAPASGSPTLPVTAVGLITDYRDSVRSPIARSLADLLATNLARVPQLPVVSTARLYEVMAQLGAKGAEDAGAYSAAARRAGAMTLIDGGLYRVSGDSLRLELRRIDLATGNVVAAFTITGTDIFALVDRTTARLAAQLGSAAPPGSVADVTTHSEVGSRFYEEGLRAYYYGDVVGSRRLFQAALDQDSTMAMAEYYLAQATPGFASVRHMERALRFAERASDRERLIIRSAWMLTTADPRVLASTESLAVRFPQELEGPRLAGRALIETGDYPAAIRRLREVIVKDSLALGGASPRCSACEAWYDLIGVYILMDSMDVAEREARLATGVKRVSALTLLRLADVFLARGDVSQARDVYGRAAQIDATLSAQPSYFAYFYLPAGDYETVDRALREIAQSGSTERRASANWFLTISLRNQGRLAEALEVARMQRAQALAAGVVGPPEQVAFQHAQVLFELGRYREAAALFDSIATAAPGFSPSHQARFRAWALAHASTALFGAGDTVRLKEHVDTIAVVGSRSLLARDRRLHHYARGLLLVARGQDQAAVGELRRASISPVIGFTRIHYEMGRALLRLGRASEAVDALRATVHGPLEGSNLYVTHTDLRALLGQASDSAGIRDSALVQYRQVLKAWQRADSSLGPRAEAVRARVATLTASVSRPQ